ncbi:hypothetical protein HOE425_320398 [Hoeflea sp. EC-HK425]|nr:hypothetical protein HOE425_320398 [Hoeflea sp. EC-HK425]
MVVLLRSSSSPARLIVAGSGQTGRTRGAGALTGCGAALVAVRSGAAAKPAGEDDREASGPKGGTDNRIISADIAADSPAAGGLHQASAEPWFARKPTARRLGHG